MENILLSQFSVLMSVYWKESPSSLKDCFVSLSNQTLKPNETILVEDGPLGEELNLVIDQFRDILKINSIRLEKNYGLAYALNVGLKHCSNELVARMDTDDICKYDRFEKQLKFMQYHPEIGVCGSYATEFKEDIFEAKDIKYLPLEHKELYKFAKKRCPLNHMTVLFRKSIVLSVGGYPLICPEDYALWSVLLVNNIKMANIPESLVYIRTNNDFYKRRGKLFFKGEFNLIKFQRKLGFLTFYEFCRNVTLRFFLRYSPDALKILLYSYARKKIHL